MLGGVYEWRWVVDVRCAADEEDSLEGVGGEGAVGGGVDEVGHCGWRGPENGKCGLCAKGRS